MSILLDALKKSEEQRQLGKTPEIHDRDDYRPEAPRARGRAWIPLAMTAVAAVLMAVIVWQQFEEPEMDTVSGEAASGPRQLPQIGSGVPRRDAGPEEAASEASNPVANFRQAETPAQSGSEEPKGTAAQNRKELARSVSEYQAPEAGKARPPVASTDSARPASEPQAPAGQARQPTGDTAGPHVSAPVSYWELPQSVRDGMPELRVSVMVYAENPEDRFLLINGRRMVEKEAMEGLVLEEIRRDGAVFRYRSYRFLLKG